MNFSEEKLLKEFNQITGDEKLSNELLDCLKRDFVLVVKEPRFCSECFNCHQTGGIPGHYCTHYGLISDVGRANVCSDYLSGGESARKSIAVLHNSLTGDLIYDK